MLQLRALQCNKILRATTLKKKKKKTKRNHRRPSSNVTLGAVEPRWC